MVNPFTYTAKVVRDFYRDASASDCAPGPAKVGVTALLPIVVPVSFVAAFFKKGK